MTPYIGISIILTTGERSLASNGAIKTSNRTNQNETTPAKIQCDFRLLLTEIIVVIILRDPEIIEIKLESAEKAPILFESFY